MVTLLNWNIEWMNNWFVPISEGPPAWRAADPALTADGAPSAAARAAQVINALTPDAVAIQESPSREGEMRLFVDAMLTGAWDIIGPSGIGAQKLYLLVRRGARIEMARRIWPDQGPLDLSVSWPVDATGDLIIEGYQFTREPLVVELTVAGRRMILVNLHSKSKYIHGGRRLWDNEGTRPQFIAQAVRNRRRISAELMRVRQWLDAALDADPEARIAVLGDMNDGPGVDFFEAHYLINNVVAIVAGNPFNPRRMLRHAFIDRELKEQNFTARFDDFIDDIRDRPLLLDHILLSPSLYWGGLRNARIEHATFEAAVGPGSGRDDRPSDHRPQSVTLEFG